MDGVRSLTGYGFYWDPTYILVIIGAVLCLIASAKVKLSYKKYAKIRSACGLTGAQVAERILTNNGITDVQIRMVAGELSDHYDPGKQVVNLSREVYDSTSIAAVSIAAHECGHVLQHKQGYVPIAIRTALVPVANIGSHLGLPMILIGLLLSAYISNAGGEIGLLIAKIGVVAFSLAVLFQVVTLPVEFNASSRALKMLGDYGILGTDEGGMAKSMLSAAAMTYVAAAASSILQLLRLILIVRGNSRSRD
ncbi:MAG: zinc metallopeptidase [Lachnospiraceae bacterium]|nr:zinc metallopeptidase [Lachnospiraceae bacterium]